MTSITIITVVYNGAPALEETIKSIESLRRPNLEYIVIDGGSNDGTVDVIKKYASTVTTWISEPDKGLYDAMNKGWILAKDDSYILFLGAGDKILSLPQELKDSLKVYYGDVMIGGRPFKSTHGFLLRLGSTIHHQALLIPKALHKEPPFNSAYKIYADFDFNQRLLKRNVAFEYCQNIRAFALPGGVSHKRDNIEMLSIVKKNFGIFFLLLAGIYYKLQNLKK